ncbi:MAG: rhodanese-like domain-containing protein [Lachnospiraceae bacterium]|nr:rhodanese-like domain-containing protein [Lachnospiraceae bacterium]
METISAKELEWYAREGKSLIIDLRSRDEFVRSHVPGAVNVPQGRFCGELRGKEKEPIILYCDRGALSMAVARDLEKRGYRTKSVVGGFLAYRGKMVSHND